MNAAEVLTNNNAYTALRSLQGLNRLYAQAFDRAASFRYTAYDGTLQSNSNAEAQMEHREQEFMSAVNAQAAYWKMDPMEVLALATGEHRLQNQ